MYSSYGTRDAATTNGSSKRENPNIEGKLEENPDGLMNSESETSLPFVSSHLMSHVRQMRPTHSAGGMTISGFRYMFNPECGV